MKPKRKKEKTSTALERHSSVSKAEEAIFGHTYGFPEFKFLFSGELHTCVQNLIFTEVVEGC